MSDVTVYAGGKLGDYNFGVDHPFGPARQDAFLQEFHRRGLNEVCALLPPAMAKAGEIERFHTAEYVSLVKRLSETGGGFLDSGDTPAFPGVYEAAARVVGTVLKALEDIVQGDTKQAFVPIAGLHHARRDRGAGFCVFNDCGVAIETLRQVHQIRRIAYVDIDAHHGDGVFYAFEEDPDLFFFDIHEDGRYLYPGSGAESETGKGAAVGTKYNIPLPPGADDAIFLKTWNAKVDAFMQQAEPEFIILQCGVDCLAGDPITHLLSKPKVHHQVAICLKALAQHYCDGRLLALGGGGYNLANIATGWCAVVMGLLKTGMSCHKTAITP
jgi:acetoin utilization protein AcuC